MLKNKQNIHSAQEEYTSMCIIYEKTNEYCNFLCIMI